MFTYEGCSGNHLQSVRDGKSVQFHQRLLVGTVSVNHQSAIHNKMAKQAFAAWETGTEAPAPLTYASGRTQYKSRAKTGAAKRAIVFDCLEKEPICSGASIDTPMYLSYRAAVLKAKQVYLSTKKYLFFARRMENFRRDNVNSTM